MLYERPKSDLDLSRINFRLSNLPLIKKLSLKSLLHGYSFYCTDIWNLPSNIIVVWYCIIFCYFKSIVIQKFSPDFFFISVYWHFASISFFSIRTSHDHKFFTNLFKPILANKKNKCLHEKINKKKVRRGYHYISHGENIYTIPFVVHFVLLPLGGIKFLLFWSAADHGPIHKLFLISLVA